MFPGVLSTSQALQIFPPVVKRIMVEMVNFLTRLSAHHLSMQVDASPPFAAVGITIPVHSPAVLAEPFPIFWVDKDARARLSFSAGLTPNHFSASLSAAI